ncbi:hypothetical protein ACOQFL_19210 [Actinopolyspora sp. H202]|uniref:hypothetical protein n=1 Tax=Actinopolyspora sp. H202 TaxID=1500456 RepID=UPI003EE63163
MNHRSTEANESRNQAQQRATADGRSQRQEQADWLDSLVPDPSGVPPLCDEPRFDELLRGIVADHAPHVFAIVQEYGERVDGRVAAWGMAFEGRAEIVTVEGNMRMSLRSPEAALPNFRFGTRIRSRLVWFDRDAITLAAAECT